MFKVQKKGVKLGVITLGPKGTFSHEAAVKLYPHKKIVYAATVHEVFFRLADPTISAAIVPIENTFSGFVEETISNLIKYDFSIIGTITLPISYHLAGKDEEIDHLYAAAQTFKQCRVAVKKYCRKAKIIETLSNGHSAIQFKANQEKTAALVSPFALDHYHLPLMAKHMEDDPDYVTIFFAIGKAPKKKKEKNASAFLIFSDPLLTTEKQIAQTVHGMKIKLLTLKSLILQEGNTPLYFMEIEGHIEEKRVQTLFETLSDKYLIKHLGSFPL